MTPSPYADYIGLFLDALDGGFVSAFDISQPFAESDLLPGERYGLLDIQSYGDDTSRPRLNNVRGGVEAKILSGVIVLRQAFDAAGMGDRERLKEINQLFASESLSLEHRINALKQDIPDVGCIYDIQVIGTIDKRSQCSLRDPDLVVVDVTADFLARFMVMRDLDGQHLYPLDSEVTPPDTGIIYLTTDEGDLLTTELDEVLIA